jgi:hypothetical protein
MVQCVTVPNVFVGVGACYLTVGHCDHWPAASNKLLLLQKHSEEPYTEPTNINKPNTPESFSTTTYTLDYVQLGRNM